MRTLNVPLMRRDEVVKIVKIEDVPYQGAAGLPAVSVTDDEKNTHILSAVDFPSYEWEKMRPGAKLHFIMKEVIVSVRILAEGESPKIPWP